jgi:membrane protease YdiL (CAAX protease family)
MSRAVAVRSDVSTSPRDGAFSPALPLGYLQKSQTPLTCFLFLLPMLILYEIGTHYFATDRIKAFDDMLRFFRWFGAGGKYLPALAVGAILLSWHIATNEQWDLDFGTAACMGLESIVWCLPLFALDSLSQTYIPLRAAAASIPRDPWSEMLVVAMGAGIYEELVFRLAAFSVLSMLLVDILRIRRNWSVLLMVVVSAVLFARYHYQDGGEAFLWHTFAFRTLAGIYFGALFLRRGFGITCGTHAAYDILAVLLPVLTAR